MEMEKVRNAFEKKGYPPNAFINKRQYENLLNSLTRGQPFHDEVAEELWNQASGDRVSNELRVSEICSTIVEAQNILKSRIREINEQISTLQKQKRRLQSNITKESGRRIEQIDLQREDLLGEKESFEDDFKLVTEPFGIQMFSSAYKSISANQGMPVDYQSNFATDVPAQGEENPETQWLKYLLYLTLGYGFIEIIMIYDKYDFLNLIVLTSLLSIYLMNFFDKIYIRFTMGIILVSIILDIVWLCLYANQKWNPPKVGNNSIFEAGFLRFVVFFTAFLIPVKIIMEIILWRHRNAGIEDKFSLALGLMKITLSGSKLNPVSKGLSKNFMNN